MTTNLPQPMPINASTEADLLAVIQRLLPESFLGPIQTIGPGYELYQAMSAAMARVSQGVAVLDSAAFIGTATSAALATALVRFSRPTATAGALTVLPGTVVTTSATGRDFILQFPVAFGADDLISAPVSVQAVAASFEFNNCLGPIVTAAGELVPGDIDTIKALFTSPDYADPTIVVAQYADASGGAMADLDQIGADQDMLRQPGESDAQYRARLRLLPDVVSPGAIDRYVAAFFQQFAAAGAQYALAFVIETWQLDFCTAYDVPNQASLDPSNPLYALGLNTCFFMDDTRLAGGPNIPNPSGYFGRLMSINDYRGAFICVVPLLPSISDTGFFPDDPGTSPIGTGQQIAPLFETPLGYVGASFFDVPTNLGGSPPSHQGFLDGNDLGRNSVYSGLFAALDQIKAGGVCVEIVLYNLS